MQLTVKGKHLNIGDSLREHVRAHLSHTAEKYFKNPVDATVIFTKEKGHRYRADVSVHLGGGVVLQAQHEADDPYPAFDTAAHRVAQRLARYKDRVRDHHRWDAPEEMHKAAYSVFEANENDTVQNDDPVIVAETQTQVPALAVADAVMRLELGDLPALLFRNAKTTTFNLVYRRKDGNIGWIEPAVVKAIPPAVKAQVKKPVAKKKVVAKKPAAKKAPAKILKKKPAAQKRRARG
jgi:ribosomal subunit interface protein